MRGRRDRGERGNGLPGVRTHPRPVGNAHRRRGLSGGRLDDAYARVERFLSVGPPDPGSVGRDQELMRLGAERLGWRVIDDRRNHLHCGGCNVCTWGCPTGAKQSTLVSYLPRAMAFGATVWSGCRVDSVMMVGKQAMGVRGRVVGRDGPEPSRSFEVRAHRVVLCAGALQTPALLQRSGVRSPSRQIGRNLAVHPGAAVTALFDDPVDGWKGAHQSLQVREFEADGVVLAAVNLPPSLVARSLPLVTSICRRSTSWARHEWAPTRSGRFATRTVPSTTPPDCRWATPACSQHLWG